MLVDDVIKGMFLVKIVMLILSVGTVLAIHIVDHLDVVIGLLILITRDGVAMDHMPAATALDAILWI